MESIENPLEGEYQSKDDIFGGILFQSKDHLKEWCRVTGIVPLSVQEGFHQITGVRGFYVKY